MKIISTFTSFVTIALLTITLALPGVVRADSTRGWNYDNDYGSTDYNTSYDYGSTGYNTTYDYGSTGYNTTYDYGSTGYNNTYDYGSTGYNTTYDYGSTGYNTTYDYGSTGYNTTYDYGSTGGWNTPSYTYQPSNSGWQYEQPSDWNTDWQYEPPIYTTYTTPVVPVTPVIPVTPTYPAPVCSVSLSDTDIDRGDDVRLSWSTTNATHVVITDSNGETIVSTRGTSDSRTLYPRTSTTFTVYAYNAAGAVDTCTRSISVDAPTTSGNAPVCSLRVSDRSVRTGMPVLLTWDNTRAKDMTIRDQFGNVIISAGINTSRSANSGNQTVVPNQNVTYTMRVSNNNGSDTCSVSVDTAGTVINSGNITVDRVPLANVPYTGFDAGPTMTALFYLLLGVWAVGIAYYVMQRKYGVTPAIAADGAASETVPSVSPVVASNPTSTAGVSNLPTDENFEKFFGNVAAEPTFSLTQYAAQEHVFVTDEVIAAIKASAQTEFAQKAMFDALIAKARGVYPAEHGWLTIDSTRYATLNA